jgi:hypothetical protein
MIFLVPAAKEEVNRRGSEDCRESEISFMLQGERKKKAVLLGIHLKNTDRYFFQSQELC